MKRSIWLLTAVFSAALALIFYFKTRQFDQSGHARFDGGLRRLKHLDTIFSEDVLKVRFKLLDNYDDFILYEQEMAERVADLKNVPGFVDARPRAAIVNLLNDYSALLDRRLEMFQEFQSQNAVVNNSLNYFPNMGEETMAKISAEADSRALQSKLGFLLRELLGYSINPDEDPSEIQRDLAWAENWSAKNPGHADAASVANLLLHARTILSRKPAVEQLTRDLVSLPTAEKLEEISQIYQTSLTRALSQAGFYRAVLGTLCLVFVVCLVSTLAALRASNRSLESRVRERTEQLTQTNANLKTEMTERQKVQIELVRTSRMAGMAEVATSVLHNVGNVLNSINISASVVSSKLRESKSGNLSKVVAMLDAHPTDLGDFMTNHPKGRQVPAYLGQLTQFLSEEKTALLEEVDSLTKNIDHVKDIVAMQQSYAKVSGVTETLKASELVEDAVRMSASSLLRHDVQFVRDYDGNAPEITVDKHKVLQILVNLICNARQACEDSSQPEKRLTMRITSDHDWVRLAVVDNGMGIPAENLPRIFNHGFTTKKEGHGFGLHASALAAREMGGSLSVLSDGSDKGATFTLELPLNPSTMVQA